MISSGNDRPNKRLSRKEKSEGLSTDERIEQQKLRRAYIDAFKENLKAQLDNIIVVDEEGNPAARKN